MNTFLTIAGIRVVRDYADQPIPDDELHRILQAGRVTGSSQNRQQWKFFVIRTRQRLDELAPSVYAPENITGAPLAVALTTSARGTFDVGRCAQNMMLAAWDAGIGSCPNGVRDSERATQLLGVPHDESLATIISFGYPQRPIRPGEDDLEGLLRRIKRKPLDELVVWVD